MKIADKKYVLDCLLIAPPRFYRKSKNIWLGVESNFPHLGLADIAGYLRLRGHSVRILDCLIESPSVQTFRKYFKKEYVSKYSLIKYIGFTAMTVEIKKAFKIAEICKEYFPNAIIVFGGVHATFMPEEVINKEYIDIVVIGEGEITLEEIVRGEEVENINGIVYKNYSNKDYKIIYNKPRERIKNLDILPMPAFDLLPIHKYKPAKGSYKQLPAMSMLTSRGCPGKCTFCSKPLGNKLIYKSAKTIFKEVKYLIDNYGIREFQFYDDNFTSIRKNVIDFCKLIINNQIKISWCCFSRVDYVKPKMLKWMKYAGCHQIMYGIETIDKKVLNNINKKINTKHVINAVNWTKQAGIDIRLAFMVGNPGDTKESIIRNIAFVNKLNPDILIVNITTPYPGTEMFKWAKEENLILSYNWDDYDFSKQIMRLENLSEKEIKKLYNLMYKKFYLRFQFFLKKLSKIQTILDFKILLEGFYSLLLFFKRK